MQIWVLVVLMFGGLMAVGVIFDIVLKRSKRKVHMDLKHENPTDHVYDSRNKDDPLL
ncbi:hypothetical protein [Brevibacillus sp. SIMBA_040]|uniref:hypothetical protein n=1 Tax=unclassified Brevibacillus TaxID=2684853 RepID=UPI00397CB415